MISSSSSSLFFRTCCLKSTTKSSLSSLLLSNPNSAFTNCIQKRFLNIHEYQAQELFRKYDIAVPRGKVITNVTEVKKACIELGYNVDYIVKAQVLAGGRGRGKFKNGLKGGVQKALSVAEAEEYASKMLGQVLVTKQTGPEGKPCNKVYIQERLYARRELYLAILLDRQSGGPVLIGSTQGGMAIEDVAKESPEEIHTIQISVKDGLKKSQAEELAQKLGFSRDDMMQQAVDQITKLYNLFMKTDAVLLEINPLIETADGKVICADAKINIDDNAAFRQKELFALKDISQEDPRDVRAAKYDLNYIGLDGNIGCIVNGAGLAMATMDIIKLYGGDPANFLDVGGGASQDQIVEALKILNDDHHVQAILVNIFGGIMRCDLIAQGLINAVKETELRAPVVVRLQGTNVQQAKDILAKSGIRIIPADNLEDAAQKAVKIASIVVNATDLGLKVNFELK
ncbi:hypothetical protein FDP41_004561 [Naegleria fowleri]|uniref:Succinate--CoA ligase [ADP-forming] subunit beta, mitochondrial n=1 Tax=Naegleria fowleri TaxID=5763 RepID=A0A6A5BPD9_NAEFO|nr:uncharacterized protein FDP41_004561 [Naegleria fowleri]KAF0976662.1 hypothetical protein FDP41_004561 [Naegleria fowleri]CAG4710703.1 unnamed protein product [Naegleria fowleri]